MKQLLEHIARALVDNPEQVEVKQVESDRYIVLELKVAPEDMGKVIGKQGRIAKAVRAVVSIAAIKENKRVEVEIVQ